MTGLTSTARRGRGGFSRSDGGNTKEDRGSGGGGGNDRTPNDHASGEERNDGSALPAPAVNPLDSAKHGFWRRREGGEWWNDAMATNDGGNDSGVVEERRRTGGGGY